MGVVDFDAQILYELYAGLRSLIHQNLSSQYQTLAFVYVSFTLSHKITVKFD